jgi:hypothetical protein
MPTRQRAAADATAADVWGRAGEASFPELLDELRRERPFQRVRPLRARGAFLILCSSYAPRVCRSSPHGRPRAPPFAWRWPRACGRARAAVASPPRRAAAAVAPRRVLAAPPVAAPSGPAPSRARARVC